VCGLRIAVSGCRNYKNYVEFKGEMDEFFKNIRAEEIIILSGHCRGTDSMAERYAKENGYKVELYLPDWDKYGRAAGPKRNEQMVKNMDAGICFWDKKSRGTKSFIDYAVKYKKEIKVCGIFI
jgi:hypothetical protein